MNERIEKFAEQAGLLPKEIGPVVETRHMKNKQHDLEKFAALIVRECLTVINQPNGVGDDDVIRISNDVKKHFGVEE